MSFTEEQQEEIRHPCWRWVSIHDDLKMMRSHGFEEKTLQKKKENLIEASRDIRDAITKAGI